MSGRWASRVLPPIAVTLGIALAAASGAPPAKVLVSHTSERGPRSPAGLDVRVHAAVTGPDAQALYTYRYVVTNTSRDSSRLNTSPTPPRMIHFTAARFDSFESADADDYVETADSNPSVVEMGVSGHTLGPGMRPVVPGSRVRHAPDRRALAHP